MLVLFETPAGYALFKVQDEAKLKSVEDIQACFADEKSAAKMCVPSPPTRAPAARRSFGADVDANRRPTPALAR